MRTRNRLFTLSLGSGLIVALAAGAGAVTAPDKAQERLFPQHVSAGTVCQFGPDCPVVEQGELVEGGVRYSTIVIMNTEQERTTLLRVRDII